MKLFMICQSQSQEKKIPKTKLSSVFPDFLAYFKKNTEPFQVQKSLWDSWALPIQVGEVYHITPLTEITSFGCNQ